MSLREELLNPIAGPNPGGIELRYDPIYDKIKEARREDDDVPQGEWAVARKTADWPLVIKLSKEALANKSKDLQIAAWLTEALVRREGFPGLRSGFDLLAGLIDQHWDHLYPEIDDGDAEMRAAPLEWISLKMDMPVRRVPIDTQGHDYINYKESRTVPTEETVAANPEKSEAREEAIAAGKATPEDIEVGFGATPKAWYKTFVADIVASLDALKALDDTASAKFGNVAPSFSRLTEAIEEIQRSANSMLKRKLELDPDPVELPTSDTTSGVAVPQGVATPGSAAAPRAGGSLAAEPTSRDDAASRIIGAARYLRQNDPFNPASYLLLRGFRWGELRASGKSAPNPKLLEAPATNLRTALKGLLLDSRWPDLLEAAEGVMGTPQGRGWLDLQRYALTACDALGSDYFPVATAMRGALRALLSDLPQLVDMTMMDDTPTANAETRAWLRTNDLLDGDGATAAPRDSVATARVDGAEPRGRDPVSLANAEVRAGRPDRAIALLMRESQREKTNRGRFLLQAQLARIMVEAGHDAVATPILEQLIADVESHKLEEWEAGELVAAPMALYYRVLEKIEGDPGTRQSLYLRICRLDPIQAISFQQS
ncbi:MAG TPA: type VI secretion system protein TssA [Gemmatimonadaceae bacterium]